MSSWTKLHPFSSTEINKLIEQAFFVIMWSLAILDFELLLHHVNVVSNVLNQQRNIHHTVSKIHPKSHKS